MHNRIRAIGALVLAILWAGLTAFTWFAPAKETSDSERRPLNQMPKLNKDSILSGKFFQSFEKYANDQFPGRDFFRSIKAVTHQYGLQQLDNNDIYLSDGYLAKQEYPLNTQSVTDATSRFQTIYNTFLKGTGCRVYSAVIPDKNYYLAGIDGHLSIDYDALFAQVQADMPYAEHISLTDLLSKENYYYTDTHWRQETLIPVAEKLCQAMDMPAPTPEEFTATDAGVPFYGVYYGQAALPLGPETMYLMESQRLAKCQVSAHNMMTYIPLEYNGVYDLARLNSKEPYDVFLSGTNYSVIRVENPDAATDRELVIFRDSFGSAIAPLLISEYRTVTLVDLRYFDSRMLQRPLTFDTQDVLFLHSTLVLNSGMIR